MADSQRKTANLFDGTLLGGYYTNENFALSGDEDIYKSIKVYLSAGTYTFSWGKNVNIARTIIDGVYSRGGLVDTSSYTITTTTNGYVGVSFRDTTSSTTVWDITTPIMLNTGSTALPYEPYGWQHSLRKLTTATEAVENPLYSDGTAITAYTIKGNTVQSGTPTPSNPVEVQGVGNKTANLFNPNETTGITDSSYINQSANIISSTSYYISAPIMVSADTDYTWQFGGTFKHSAPTVGFYDSNDTIISAAQHINATTDFTFTTPSNCAYIRASVYKSSKNESMLSETSAAIPFEPYGYKIPISSAGQTIDIYIGDLPLLKSLDGTAVDEISNDTLTRRVDSDGSVLPTPTTTQITMPSIPTTDGANTITVDTTVQPSEFTATWTGWHDSSVKEWDGSQWQ